MRFVATLVMLVAVGAPAWAQAPNPAADASLRKGRALMRAGRFHEACDAFEESQRLDPSPSTLLNLASCYEKTDRPATAWVTYREGASAASVAAVTLFRVGNAQSLSSMTTPWTAALAAGISNRFKLTG